MPLDSNCYSWPPLTQEPILHVDSTPDLDYPLRILKAYRENCKVRWKADGLVEQELMVFQLMNDAQRKRAEILDVVLRHLDPDVMKALVGQRDV